MKQLPQLQINDEQIEIIKYGLSIFPKVQNSIHELKQSKNYKSNNTLAKSTLKKFEKRNIDSLNPEEFRIMILAIHALYLISLDDILIDEESSKFVSENLQDIRLLQAIIDLYNPQ